MGQCVLIIDVFSTELRGRLDEEHNFKETIFTFQT